MAKCHQRRNEAEYEGYMDVEEGLLRDLISAVRTVAEALDRMTPPRERGT
jgi:hypothetical protein